MLTTLIGNMITALIKLVPEDIVRRSLDKWLDMLEESIEASSNKIDDCALPLIVLIRKQIGITEDEGSPYEDVK